MSARHHRPHRLARCWRVLVGLVLATMAAPAQAELLAPTPLILKDGRIASVSVHVLPFAAGQATIDSDAGRSLVSLTRQMATDCFLTAQVIGHVGSEEVESSDTLAAHRLARSRADAVQASLIDTGLPAKSIASVWDWQFMVLEARATLWVFELTRGEDCEGKPLEGVVAAAPAPEPAAAEAPATAAGARVAQPSAAANPPRPRSGAADGAAAPDRLTTTPARADREESAAPAAVRARPAAAPTAARPEAPASSATATAARPEAPASSATAAAARPTRQVARAAPSSSDPAAERSLSIVFATNSSYFPAGARKQLESLVGELASGGRYRVELIASVSNASAVVGAANSEEAARYNQWLANRRLDRVQSWLEVNAKDKDLIIQPGFVPEDDSRRVVITITPAKTS